MGCFGRHHLTAMISWRASLQILFVLIGTTSKYRSEEADLVCGLRKPEGRIFSDIVRERLSYSFANKGKGFFLKSKRRHAGPDEGRTSPGA